jgi:hypothetical protein
MAGVSVMSKIPQRHMECTIATCVFAASTNANKKNHRMVHPPMDGQSLPGADRGRNGRLWVTTQQLYTQLEN